MNVQEIAQRTAARKRAAVSNLWDLKDEHRERANELWQSKIENREAAKMRSTERDLTEGHHLDLYPTPEWLAVDMVSRCDDPIFDGALWCEPSAGTGRIVQAMLDAGHTPFLIELNYNAAHHLMKKYPSLTVFNKDFLECGSPEQTEPAKKCYDCRVTPPRIIMTPARTFTPPLADVFVMNPPFSHGQDIDHVLHAYKYLGEGGRIVAIMAEGTFYRSDKKATQFRSWFDEVCGQAEKLPDDTFKESGANVKTRLVTIDK